MSADNVARSYLLLADEEIRSAQLLAPTNPRQALYFTAQAAEKAARAILAKQGIAFGTSHNLGQMAVTLAPEDPLRPRLLALDRLSPASTRTRYPNPRGALPAAPTAEMLKVEIADVTTFIGEVKRALELGSSSRE